MRIPWQNFLMQVNRSDTGAWPSEQRPFLVDLYRSSQYNCHRPMPRLQPADTLLKIQDSGADCH